MKGQKGRKGRRAREFAVRLCLLVISEATLIKSHQHDNLNMSCIRTTIDMPKWTNLLKELQETKDF